MQQANSFQVSSNLQGRETKVVTLGHTDFTLHEPSWAHAKRACRLYLGMIGCEIGEVAQAMAQAEDKAGEGEPDYGKALLPFAVRAMMDDTVDIDPRHTAELLAIVTGEPEDYWLTTAFAIDEIDTLVSAAGELLPFVKYRQGATSMVVGMVNSYARSMTASAPSSDSGADTPPTSSPGTESAGASGTPSA